MTRQRLCSSNLNRSASPTKGAARLVAAFALLSSAASGTASAQVLDGGADAGADGGADGGLDAAVGDAAVGDGSVGDGGASDAGASDAAVVDAGPPPSYFVDRTETNFPPPLCTDLADAGSSAGCFTHWLTLSDLDSDGDLDILFANGGGYYVQGNAEPSAVYTNDGTGAFRNVTTDWFGGAVNRNRQVSVGDIDGDGDLDVYQPGSYGLDLDKLWIQTAPRTFVNVASTNLPSRLRSKAGASHFADLDGDGDLDLAIADWGDAPVLNNRPSGSGLSQPSVVRLYLNDGKGTFSELPSSFTPPPQPNSVGRTPIDIDTADIDGDFDLDILLNNRNGQSRILINDGHAKFTDGTLTAVEGGDPILNYPKKTGPYTYNQEVCDIDYDGDLDLLLDNAFKPTGASGNFTQININDGKGHFTDTTASLVFGDVGSDDNAVKCADVSGDGKYDVIVASLASRTGEKLFIRDAENKFNAVIGGFPSFRDPSLGIDAADLDGDGILDVVTGQGEGSPMIDKYYKGYNLSGKDVSPPTFRAIEEPDFIEPNSPIVIRFAPIDAHTSETGEHVKLVSLDYKIGTAAAKTLKATFIGGDLYRVVIPGQPNGTIVTIMPSATDRSGLKSAPVEISLLVGTPIEPQPDAGMEPTEDGGMVVEPENDAGSDPVPEPEPEEDAGDEPGDGEPVDEPEPMDDAGVSTGGGQKGDDGCSVSAGGSDFNSNGLVFGLGLAALALRRTRKTRRRD